MSIQGSFVQTISASETLG